MKTIKQRPKCEICIGEGFIFGFFEEHVECDHCEGTGYELILPEPDEDPYADAEWAGGVEC